MLTQKAVAGPPSPYRLMGIMALVLLLGASLLWFITSQPSLRETQNAIPNTMDPAAIAHGEYLAKQGNCIACHTALGGAVLAGERPIATPFGILYSTNITPDPKFGIGACGFAAFDRAMRKGINADGDFMYPAMPYPSFAKITPDDMHALYAYFMKGVQPAATPNKPIEIGFPFNQRRALAFWNSIFNDAGVFQLDPNQGEEWNRGAYLVQGFGHCGVCHTPRGIGFQEKALTEKGRNGGAYLAGATIDHWHALTLRNPRDIDGTIRLLKTGHNAHMTIAGSMTEVVHNSTQYFTDSDLKAVAVYLKSLAPNAYHPPKTAQGIPDAVFTTRGGLAYAQFCSACHRLNGSGLPSVLPPLAGNPAVQADDPATQIHITLTGWDSAQTQTNPRAYTMPGFARLSDSEIAEILNFVRKSWGKARPIAVHDVKAARADINPKIEPHTFQTPRIADILKEPNAAQILRGMRLNLQTHDLLPDNVGNGLSCTSCHLNTGTVANGAPYIGVAAFFPSYAPRAGRVISLEDRINGCFLRSMHGKPLAKDSDDLKAIVAYFDWMKGNAKPTDTVEGRGVGKVSRDIMPDSENGKRIYAGQCAACHGSNGEGIHDAKGRPIYPALWGDASFNIGAGMARTYTAAAFVKHNMPVANRQMFPLAQGGLTDQQAVDVSEYFSHMPRPDFSGKVNDWPNDKDKAKKPNDARY